ncbi:MAG: alpha/beta hydrolase [Muribaculum sp.]|nr:alpha/beta hydrolase [Muribaculum sp.]
MKYYAIITTAVTMSVAAVFMSSCDKSAKDSRESLSTGWHADILGDGFESRYIDMGDSYDGPVRSTVIRRRSECGDSMHRGVLYVHGFNDYFFQRELAERMADSCYSFYAVDLRRYGRSLLPHQRRFDVHDDSEYFADIDSALAVMRSDGIDDVTLMGHSTGGLTTSLYMTEHPDTIVKRLILNSPFLDWNLSSAMERFAVPVVSWLGRFFHKINIPQGSSGVYGRSLLQKYGGEWDYRTDWKLTESPDVTSGWISAIDRAQHELRDRTIGVPVLLMHSDRSGSGADSTANDTDIVLDVEDIHRYGSKLGHDVEEAVIPGGIHDLVLSRKEARDSTYNAIFSFLH